MSRAPAGFSHAACGRLARGALQLQAGEMRAAPARSAHPLRALSTVPAGVRGEGLCSSPPLGNPNKVQAEPRAMCSSFLGCLLLLSCSGQLRACREENGGRGCGAGLWAAERGRPQMFWDSCACLRRSRERSAWSPCRSDWRLISDFWLRYRNGPVYLLSLLFLLLFLLADTLPCRARGLASLGSLLPAPRWAGWPAGWPSPPGMSLRTHPTL